MSIADAPLFVVNHAFAFSETSEPSRCVIVVTVSAKSVRMGLFVFDTYPFRYIYAYGQRSY